MDLEAVPQEGNKTLDGHRKVVYARAADGRLIVAPSAGWEVEEIVTMQAVAAVDALAQDARERAARGQASTLECWMHSRRMDVDLLAQATGLWRWRVRRHLRPQVFARLSVALLDRYAEALGVGVDQLGTLP